MTWFHRHGPWETVGAFCDRNTHYIAGGPGGQFGYFAVTHVALRRKSCGELKTKSISGLFTLKQLKGESDEISKVLATLEKT